LKDCYIRKAKILRRPKFDAYKLAELHVESARADDQGTPVVVEATTDVVVEAAPAAPVPGTEGGDKGGEAKPEKPKGKGGKNTKTK